MWKLKFPQTSLIFAFILCYTIILDYNAINAKGDVNMCTVFEETRKEALAEGKIEGKIEGEAKGIIETGLAFGIAKDDILKRLQEKMNISLDEAQNYFTMFAK